ncbi:MAG: hypothetical protein Q8P73_02240, partial [bacterium]|nr:hypothetical protein [bacterium]
MGPRQDSLYHESGSVAGITDASPTPDDNSVIPGSDPESTGILNQVQDDDAVRHSGSQNPESTGNDNETTEQWNNGDQYIVWENVSIKAGEKIELKYTFKAPDVSPEFYLLGPLKLTTHNLELGTDSSSVVPDLPTGQAGSEPESTSGTTGPVVLGNEGPPASTAGNPSFAWVEPRSWQIAADASVFDQKHFRIYEDDAALNSATAYAAEDTNKSVLIGANFRLRFSVANTGDAAGDITRRLEFSEDAGDWTQITTGTNNVRLVNSTEFTDGDATTALLTPTGTFAAGQGKDTGSDTSQISLTNAYYVEDEYALKFETAADGHSYQFRITNAGTAISYTNTPNIAATTKQYMGGDEDGWAVAESITFQWPALTDAGYTWPEDPQDGTEQYAGGDEDGWDTGSNAFVWVGAGVDSNCSTVANWDQGAVPDTFNDIIFDDTDTTDAVWDSGCPATVRSLSLVSGYTGTVSLGQSIAVSTNLALQAGTLDASDDAGVTSYNLTVAGNWTNSGGTFTARTGTVTLDGTNQSLSGTNTFYNLTKTEASDDSTDATLTIGASSTQTITNTLNIGGLDDNDRLNLVSSTPSTKWTFDITAADLWVRWLDVTDGQASTNDIVATQSVGSNTDAGEATPHWEFGVTKTWAAAAAANCSAAAGNWSPAALPTRADDILLNATSTQNLTWDATCPQEVYSYTQDTGYTGTATINTVYGESGFTVFTTMDDLTINAGTMAHGDNSTAETYNLDISVGGDLTVASGGTINVDGLGYNAGYGPGIGSSTQAGGSYGGLGGVYTGVAGSTYGSVTAPVNLGSGSSVANAGGGAILLTVTGSSTISGTISANGNGGTQYYSGAGGSVYLTTGTITGAGTVIANGGSVTDALTGGGGRVAIVLTGSSADFSSFGSATVTAYGGSGITTSLGGWGAAGTVYKQTTIEGAGHGDLIIDNNNPPTQYQQPLLGVTTAIPGSTSWSGFTSITMRNAGIIGVPTSTTLDITNVTMNGDSTNYNGGVQLSGGTFTTPAAFSYTNYLVRILSASTFNPVTSVTVGNQATLIDDVANTFSGDLIIDSGGNITHDANWSTALGEQYKVNLTIGGDLSVNGTGTINVNGKGYSTGNGPGYGSSTQAGGSYGGLGAIYSGVVGKTYGSATAPVNIGSGGSGGGAAGGGAAILTVSGLSTIAGTIGADGADPVDYWGGSGGSVYLTTGTITGSGTISANGGSAPNQDSGGGGRVAVILTGGGADFSGFSGGSITAYGGTTPSSGTHGAAGTVYKQTTAQGSGYGDLIIDNNSLGSQASVVTDLDGEDANTDTTVGSVTIANAGKFKIGSDDALTVSGAITVASGTTLDNDGALTADNIANSGTASFDTASNTLTLLGDGDAAADSYTLTDIATTFYNLILNATDGSLDTFVLGN